eukprot:362611-Chlamydomonas_euryale.AAC.4
MGRGERKEGSKGHGFVHACMQKRRMPRRAPCSAPSEDATSTRRRSSVLGELGDDGASTTNCTLGRAPPPLPAAACCGEAAEGEPASGVVGMAAAATAAGAADADAETAGARRALHFAPFLRRRDCAAVAVDAGRRGVGRQRSAQRRSWARVVAEACRTARQPCGAHTRGASRRNRHRAGCRRTAQRRLSERQQNARPDARRVDNQRKPLERASQEWRGYGGPPHPVLRGAGGCHARRSVSRGGPHSRTPSTRPLKPATPLCATQKWRDKGAQLPGRGAARSLSQLPAASADPSHIPRDAVDPRRLSSSPFKDQGRRLLGRAK